MTDRPQNAPERPVSVLEKYLRDLRRGLRGLPVDEIDDISREIASHLHETGGSEDGSMEIAIRRLGSAADLAARYRTDVQLERARGGYSPFALMHALLQWASISLFGFLTALAGIVGYGVGLALFVVAMVKPFFPEVGLWVGPETLVIGAVDDPAARELLGWWLIPFGLLAGLILIIVTSRSLRWLIGHRPGGGLRRSTGVMCVLAALCLPTPAAAVDLGGLRAEVAEILEDEGVPGAGIAVIVPDGSIQALGVGVADVDNGTPVTGATSFRAGSIGKSFTAVLIMQLVAEGRLSLDSRLRDLAPEVPFENPWQDTSPVRVRHLLEHSTGFDDISLSEGWSEDPAVADMSLDEVLHLRRNPLRCRFEPGSMTSYSNPGYTILGYLAEKMTSQPFADLVRQRIFLPLGLSEAEMAAGPGDDVATGYEVGSAVALPSYLLYHRPAGALTISAVDLARFVRLLIGRGAVDDTRLLPVSLVAEMERPHATLVEQTGLEVGFGLGIESDLRYPTLMHGHDGGMPGFIGTYAYQRDEGFGLVVLLNALSPGALSRIRTEVFEAVAGARQPPVPRKVSGDELTSWTGHYRLMTYRPELAAPIVRLTDRIDLRVENGQLVEEHAFGPRRYLVGAAEGGYRRAEQPVSSRRLMVDEQGRRWVITPSNAYLEANPWLWRGELAGVVLLLVASLSPLLGLPVCGAVWLWRKIRPGRGVALPLFPVLAAASLAVALVAPTSLGWMELATVNPATVALAVASVAFALFAGFGVLRAMATRRRVHLSRWSALQTAPALVQVALSLYLWHWGLLGLRLWAA